MKKILVIPGEAYPAHQSFMAEVLSKENTFYQSVFLMRTHDYRDKVASWNRSPVHLMPYTSKIKLINIISWYFCIDLRYFFLIPKIVFKEKIDIIHVRDLTVPLFVALILKLLFRKKVLYQKSFPIEYARLIISKESTRKFKNIAILSRKFENFLLHKLMRFTDKVLPISEYMSDNLHNHYKIPKKIMHPFGMGFNFEDSKELYPRTPNAPPPYKILYVGTLGGFRQFDILLEGMSIFSSKHSDIDCIFEFVGGSEEEISQLENHANKLGIQTICHFAGYLSREEVYASIANSHIGISWFGNGPQFIDASPTKMMEYLAIGLPIVAVDSVILHKDIIQATHAGIICKVDAEDFAEKISLLVADYSAFRENASVAIEYIKEHHSYTTMRNDYKNLLETI